MNSAFIKFLTQLNHNDKLHVAKSPPQVLRPGEPPKTVIMLVVLDQAGNAVPNVDTACFVLGEEGDAEALEPVPDEPTSDPAADRPTCYHDDEAPETEAEPTSTG